LLGYEQSMVGKICGPDVLACSVTMADELSVQNKVEVKDTDFGRG